MNTLIEIKHKEKTSAFYFNNVVIPEIFFRQCIAQKLLDKDPFSVVTASSFISFSFLMFICGFTPDLQ